MTVDTRTLNIVDAVAIATIIGAAQRNARVAWLLKSGDVGVGTARQITTADGNWLRHDEDVRNGYLWVTTDGGMETWLPLAELMPKVATGEFVVDYDGGSR
jgi:hypothetical protein